MKTIEVTDEMYNFISELSKEIKSQDNRGTAFPYFFQVQEDEQIGVPDGCGEIAWVSDGETILKTDDEIKEAVFEWNNWTIGNVSDEKKYKMLDQFDIEEITEENYRKVNISTTQKYSNCFFTYKAYEEHVRKNGHNLNNPKSFLFHAYRNTEMEMLFKFLNDSF